MPFSLPLETLQNGCKLSIQLHALDPNGTHRMELEIPNMKLN